MRLSELLKNIDIKNQPYEDMEITAVVYDSRKAIPGSLFVAIRGYQTDGHKYIDAAVKAGAAVVLAEEAVNASVPVLVTANTRKALAVVSAKWFGDAHRKMKFIGVTGTNGKTTITYLIKQILELSGKKCGLIGTNQNMIGKEVLPTERTTPESFELHQLFEEMASEQVDYVIMEVSSHSLALYRVYGIEFEVGVFTNLTQDHLDFHKTMEGYLAEKAKLFRMCRFGIINGDDAAAPTLLETATANMVTYGFKNKTDLSATDIHMSAKGVTFHAEYQGIGGDIRLGIPGEFSVYNALGAIGAALMLGIGMETIQGGLQLARTVKGRAEVVPLPLPFTVIIDYAHTPDGLENIIRTVKGFAKGRVITLFGCGGDRDKTKRPKMGRIAGELSDFSVVTSDNPRTEDPEAIIQDILEGMTEFEDKYDVVVNRKDAIRHALSIAQEEDVIILAGKGHETYQIVGTEKHDFDERVILQELTAEMRR